jgi:hypothetical protein
LHFLTKTQEKSETKQSQPSYHTMPTSGVHKL